MQVHTTQCAAVFVSLNIIPMTKLLSQERLMAILVMCYIYTEVVLNYKKNKDM